MLFKQVGKLSTALTELEVLNGLYAVPRLKVLMQIKLCKPEIESTDRWPIGPRGIGSKRIPASKYFIEKYVKPMALEVYYVVKITQTDIYNRDGTFSYAYHFVKARNYKKYVANCLLDKPKKDYCVIRECSHVDKAINLGFINIL
jgi:hypothetical protein